MKSRWLSITLRVLLVAAVVLLTVRYARTIDWHALWQAASHANLWLLLLSGLGNVPLVWTKARRIRILLGSKLSTRPLMGMYFTSYAADNMVMSQAGLGVRLAYFRMNDVSVATGAAALAVEKAIEGLGLGLLVMPFLFRAGVPTKLHAPVLWTIAAAAVALLVVVLLPRSRNQFLQRVGEAAVQLKRPTVLLETIALTTLAWICEALMVFAVFAALGMQVNYWGGAALVLVAVNMAALIPGLPANLGAFEVSCTLALKAVGVPATAALSFALLYHIMHTVPVTLIGVVTGRSVRKQKPALPPEGKTEATNEAAVATPE